MRVKCDESSCITRAMSQFTINAVTNEGNEKSPLPSFPKVLG